MSGHSTPGKSRRRWKGLLTFLLALIGLLADASQLGLSRRAVLSRPAPTHSGSRDSSCPVILVPPDGATVDRAVMVVARGGGPDLIYFIVVQPPSGRPVQQPDPLVRHQDATMSGRALLGGAATGAGGQFTIWIVGYAAASRARSPHMASASSPAVVVTRRATS